LIRESVAILLGEIARWHGFERFQDDVSILAIEVSVSSGVREPNGSFTALTASVSPNPLNPEATLTFTTSKPGAAKVDMFDVKGSLVRTILGSTFREAGRYKMKIDDRGESGEKLAPGVYFVRGTTADGTFKNTITILK